MGERQDFLRAHANRTTPAQVCHHSLASGGTTSLRDDDGIPGDCEFELGVRE